MGRVTRMGIGLVALLPVLGITGSLLVAAGVESEAAALITLGVGVLWIVAMAVWSQHAAPARSDEASRRYWAALRHAQFGPRHHVDDEAA